MKKLVLLMAVLFVALSCTPTTDLNDEETAACPAPDTNCNGIPDHEEGLTHSGG